MNRVPSPNFNDRATHIKLDYIVLHYTGMKDAHSALTRLCDPQAEVSAHYMISEDGTLTQLVEESKRAWHAGKSFWRGITDMNSASIGIELANPGHEWGYRAFPPAQINALKKLLSDIIARQKLNSQKCFLAHSDIAPSRKEDPGEYFPWQELAQEGLGLWPTVQDNSVVPDGEVNSLLSAIGYDIADPQRALLAFQRRFHPQNLSGIADPETLARLGSVKTLWCA